MKTSSQSPYDLDNDIAYQRWRDKKLTNAHTNRKVPIINIKKTPPHFLALSPNNDSDINNEECFPVIEILTECNLNNYCLYKLEYNDSLDSKTSKQLILKLAQSCGISHLDNNICADENSLSSIYNKNTKNQREYIPYTNRKLSWHTDGYYNTADKTIYSMLLHCHKDANSGGESAFIDHEIVYIMLRDENPEWIKALNHPQAMTIPANVLNDELIREEHTGPVFSITPQDRLHMRFSARTRNISWQQDKATQDAIEYLKQLLDVNSSENTSKYIIKHKLKAGEGIITRNVLHCREAFTDTDDSMNQRLLFRGRYYDELPDTIKVN